VSHPGRSGIQEVIGAIVEVRGGPPNRKIFETPNTVTFAFATSTIDTSAVVQSLATGDLL
jgi:hypothetical protein